MFLFTLLDLQIRVPDRQFLLGNLNPGEAYEITVRTAIGAEIVSSAAAIVEISLPKGLLTYQLFTMHSEVLMWLKGKDQACFEFLRRTVCHMSN